MIKNITTPQPNYFSKAPQWILWAGILLFLVGIVMQIAFPQVFRGNDTADPIDKILSELPIAIVYIATTIAAPLIEELGFRGWQLKNKGFKMLAIAICFAFYYATFGLVIAIVVELAMIVICFYKPNRNSRIIGVIFTSLIFAVVHWNNYATAAYRIMAIISIIGAGFILSYLTWRFSLIWAMLFHAVYNAIGIQLMFIANDPISIKTATYDIQMEQIKHIKSYQFSFKDDKVTAITSLNTIVENWMKTYYNDSTYFYLQQAHSPKLELSITMAADADKQQVLDTLVSTLDYQFDTIVIPKYRLTLPEGVDTPVVTLIEGERYLHERLEYIVNTLKIDHNLAVFYDQQQDDRIITISSLGLYKASTEEVIKAFKKSGIHLIKDTTKTVKGVRLKPKELQ